MTPTTDATFLGRFTLNPADPGFEDLRAVCEPGNPWRCLIATKASMELGKRMTVRLDHEERSGVIGVTWEGWRFQRPMTGEEVRFARKFDLGQPIRKPLTVVVDLNDGTWTGKPKAASGGAKTAANNQGRGPGNKRIKSIRARQLEAIRKGTAAEADAA